MPLSIVVGGQFGSEGKGKVALEIVRRDSSCVAAVRVGGSNSGHTAVDRHGVTRVLRQIPAAAIDRSVSVVLPPGSYIDVGVLRKELDELGLGPDSVFVSPMARIITSDHRTWESDSELGGEIGSTQSGTGAAVLSSVARGARNFDIRAVMAADVPELVSFLRNTDEILRAFLDTGKRVVVEGTQGFGLSLLHGGFWPKATSRDTTAAGLLSESGMSPLDVDDVTMVIRCHPIRVAGASGPLTGEMDWSAIAREAGLPDDYKEYTTVTKRVRRVGKFDAELVRRAIRANQPNRIVLNHLDYIDAAARGGHITRQVREFVSSVEVGIGRKVNWLGTGPSELIHLENPKSVAVA
ncbi:MAG: adenylosuccinate synthetase [Alphaproteobacteria bacterium]|nr:adenylosuccinate synthetase [Alphaproteobacteria bacterium]